MRERYRSLVGYAFLLTNHMGDAEDAVQEAIVSTFTRKARFTNVPQAEAYVRRAIASRVIDERRSRQRRKARESRVDMARLDTAQAEPVDVHVDVAAAMATLPPRVRACVALRFMADQSTAQTAQGLGLSEGAVKRYVSDGIAALGAVLGTDASDVESVDVESKGGVP
jgi:RNA polymerase sigma factor (sigma-70 family)